MKMREMPGDNGGGKCTATDPAPPTLEIKEMIPRAAARS
jgi:hypothetical protein